MIRSTRDHFSKKRFSKLDFLKTVLVSIIANSEKTKMKTSHLPMIFEFPLPFPLVSHTDFFKIVPLPNFLEISSPPFKKRE